MRNAVKPLSIVYDINVAGGYAWIYDTCGKDAVVLSIGGDPDRENPRVVNLNIGAFESVDIGGDGSNTPPQGGTVDAVTCARLWNTCLTQVIWLLRCSGSSDQAVMRSSDLPIQIPGRLGEPEARGRKSRCRLLLLGP